MRLTDNIYKLVLILVLTTCAMSCQQQESSHKIDFDSLYKIGFSNKEQDSIASVIEPKTIRALSSKNTIKDAALIDSVLDQLRWTDQLEIFTELAHTAKKDAIKENDLNRLANTYHYLSDFYHHQGINDSVYYYYLKTENIYKKLGNEIGLAENYFYQAILFYELGMQIESETNLAKALKILEAKPDNSICMLALQTMSYHYADQNNLEKTKEYLNRTFAIFNKIKGHEELIPKKVEHLFLGNLYANYSMLHYKQEEYKIAEEFALKGIEEINKTYNKYMFSVVNIDYHMALYQQGKNPNIIDGLVLSYQINDELEFPFYTSYTSLVIAEVYSELGNKGQAYKWAKNAYEISKKAGIHKHSKQAIEFILLLDSIYTTPEIVTELVEISNLLTENHRSTREKFTKIEYETALLIKENKSLKQKVTLITVISISIIFSLAFIIFYFQLKSKNQEYYKILIKRKQVMKKY